MSLPPEPDDAIDAVAVWGLGEACATPEFAFVKLPVGAAGEDSGPRLDEAVDDALRAEEVGTVLGWGSSMGEPGPDGRRPVAFHRIDLEIFPVPRAVAVVQAVLTAADAPLGTQIHYHRDGCRLQDVLASDGWVEGLPSEA